MKKKEIPHKTEQEWKEILTEEQYEILRKKGTEMPHTGKYNMYYEEGAYLCAGCGQKLFDSATKFRSNCGWLSFDNAVQDSVVYEKDTSLGMIRTEVLCANCGGHLGHVFNDGPTDTGERYCINSASLKFNQ